MFRHPFVLVALSLGLSSCFKSAVTGTAVKERSGVRLAITQMQATETEEGGVAASFSAQGTTIQTMSANEGTAIQGSSASFQPGSLAIDTSIRMEESSSIANATLTAELGLATEISQSGTAVAVLPATPTDAKQPFTLSIPLPVSVGLTNSELWTNLVVMYRVTIVAENRVVSGIIPRSDIILKNGVASIETKYFGSFQTAVTTVSVTDKVQAATTATVITKSESAKLPALTVVGRSPFVVKADGTIELNGINFRPTMIVAMGGNKVSGLKVLSDSRASFVAPQATGFGLTNVAVEQDGVAQSVSVFYAGSKTDFPIMMKPENEVCQGEKYYDAQGLLKTGSRLCKEPAICAAEGQANCMVSESFPAVNKSLLAARVGAGQTVLGITGTANGRLVDCNADAQINCTAVTGFPAMNITGAPAKILTGQSLAGVSGTAAVRPANCVADGGTDCVAVALFPAVDKATKLSAGNAAKIHSSLSIVGISGTMANCSVDGGTDCMAVTGYPAANTSGAQAKIASGDVLAGITGTAGVRPSDCSTDGGTGCVAVTNFPAVNKVTNLAVGNLAKISSSVTVGGVAGTMADCSADGTTGCLTVTAFPSANTSGANAKIITGQTLAGVSGNATPAPANCSADGQTNCVAITTFPALQKSLLTVGVLKNGTLINGVTGAYPNATYPLTGSTATDDLTTATFNIKVKASGSFEYFDSAGNLQTGSGDTDITGANIAFGIDIFSTTGTFGPNCTTDGQTACLTSVSYKAANTSNYTTWDIRSGKTVGGTVGSLAFYKNMAGSFNRTSGTGSISGLDPYDTIDDYNNVGTFPTQNNTGWVQATGANWTSMTASLVYMDNITGLLWLKDQTSTYTWDNAIAQCENSVDGSRSDWRLPTQKEWMQASIDGIWSQKIGMSLNFNNYWSASTVSDITGNAWFVDPSNGGTGNMNKATTYRVVCVAP